MKLAILKIKSTNPKFSFIVAKNPETQRTAKAPFKKSLRKGVIFGWFSDEKDQEFTTYFRDNPNEMSYSEQSFEYLDVSRYLHPFIYIGVITEMLRTASQGAPEDVAGDENGVTYEATVEFSTVIPDRQISSYFDAPPGCEVDLFAGDSPHFNLVQIKAPTVRQALALTQMICLVSAISSDDIYIPLKSEVLDKYLNLLTSANASYKMRRIFINRAISNPETMESLRGKGLIDVNDLDGNSLMTFRFGNNQVQRLLGAKAMLTHGSQVEDRILIDIGAGEMYNSLKLAGKYRGVVAYEKDPDVFETITGKVKKRQLTELVTLHKVEVTPEVISDDATSFDGSHVLLMEVLEHMPQENSKAILEAVLATEAHKVAVTVPCADFNSFYGIEPGSFRHSDHKWEPTQQDWQGFLDGLSFDRAKWTVKTDNYSDTVGGIPCTLFTLFERIGD